MQLDKSRSSNRTSTSNFIAKIMRPTDSSWGRNDGRSDCINGFIVIGVMECGNIHIPKNVLLAV